MKHFLMGNEILAKAALDAGAKAMFGYPITPTTEVLSTWSVFSKEKGRLCLQTEDEMAAGFGVCGVVLAGARAFTATGGPGMILMQDPLSMAEAMRLPVVVFDGQRGGPSTGQVIYSQQEVNMAIYGGNGEGQRIVYSTSNLQELYDYGKKVFEVAWKYRFPTILLYDGYQGKMKGAVDIPDGQESENLGKELEPILRGNIRNTYNLEEELADAVTTAENDFKKMADEVVEYKIDGIHKSRVVVVAHGIVSAAAVKAVNSLVNKGEQVSIFRPITLSPFPTSKAREVLQTAKKAIVFESSLGQLSRILHFQVYGSSCEIIEVQKPGLGFTPEEIERLILNNLN